MSLHYPLLLRLPCCPLIVGAFVSDDFVLPITDALGEATVRLVGFGVTLAMSGLIFLLYNFAAKEIYGQF